MKEGVKEAWGGVAACLEPEVVVVVLVRVRHHDRLGVVVAIGDGAVEPQLACRSVTSNATVTIQPRPGQPSERPSIGRQSHGALTLSPSRSRYSLLSAPAHGWLTALGVVDGADLEAVLGALEEARVTTAIAGRARSHHARLREDAPGRAAAGGAWASEVSE